MIHKKLLCSFVFMSLFISHGNVLANQVPLPEAIRLLMPKFMSQSFALKLGDNNIVQPMQNQWERFIKHHPREIDFSNISNSLDAFYESFVKEIVFYGSNENRFTELLRDSNINNIMLRNLLLSDFLNQKQVKAAFMVLGEDTIKDMQPNSGNLNTLPIDNPSSIPTPPPAPRLDEDQIVAELTDPNLDQKSPKAVVAARKLLDIAMDEQLSRFDIQSAFEREQANIMEQFANFPKQQPKMMEAAEVAQEILMKEVEEGNVNEPTSQPKNPVSDEFRQKVVNSGMIIAQSLFNDNIFVVTERKINQVMEESDNSKIRALRRMLSESNTDQEMAYLIGYVQSCILQIQQSSSKNISGDAGQVISRIADTLRALNMQQARA